MTWVMCTNRKPLFKDLNGLWTGSEITLRYSGRGAEILYHEEVCYEYTVTRHICVVTNFLRGRRWNT